MSSTTRRGQKDWDERTNKLNAEVKKGTLPLAIAAQGFHTTLTELVLRNLGGGAKQTDGRKRAALPLFSGRRQPAALGEIKAIALDPSAVAVLAWLGLLPKVLRTYPKIVLPASTLGEFFESSKPPRITTSTRRLKETVAAAQTGMTRTSGGASYGCTRWATSPRHLDPTLARGLHLDSAS